MDACRRVRVRIYMTRVGARGRVGADACGCVGVYIYKTLAR